MTEIERVRVEDLKEIDVIKFQLDGPMFSLTHKAIVNHVYVKSATFGIKWYAEIVTDNDKVMTINDDFDFVKVNEPFTRKFDMDKRPSHYEGKDGIDVIDFLYQQLPFEEFKGFMKGNMIKYPVRSGRKENEIEDIKKARNYADRLLEKLEVE